MCPHGESLSRAALRRKATSYARTAGRVNSCRLLEMTKRYPSMSGLRVGWCAQSVFAYTVKHLTHSSKEEMGRFRGFRERASCWSSARWTCTGGSSPLPSSIQNRSSLKSTNSPPAAAAANLLGMGGIEVLRGASWKAETSAAAGGRGGCGSWACSERIEPTEAAGA